MKNISVNINSKPIQSFITMVGFLFLISSWYIHQSTNTTTEYLFALHDIQIESFASNGIDQNQVVFDGETLRDIANKYNSHSTFGVVGLVIAGSFFLLLALGLYAFNISVNNKETAIQDKKAHVRK